ncbi:MAG: hypothetical protein FWE47_01620 [Oscillospiraceae bacterium]|nr:hypothetical protein [Oscillospiraceae bacterium]
MSKRKLLFLFPMKEYFKDFGNVAAQKFLINTMNERIDSEYRRKGFEINFLVFQTYADKVSEVECLKTVESDRIISTRPLDSPAAEQYRKVPQYPKICEQLGEMDELVICGFHKDDCVRKVEQYFKSLGINTSVDIELTDALLDIKVTKDFTIKDFNERLKH